MSIFTCNKGTKIESNLVLWYQSIKWIKRQNTRKMKSLADHLMAECIVFT